MKASLRFDLDDFHDRLAHKRAVSSTEAYLALTDILDYLRGILKYNNDPEMDKLIDNNDIGLEVIEHIKNKIFDILEERSINLNDLE